ncbi:putative helicase MOV-10 [Polyodon spathula]|uniref:putative helicase MOV-10 n=1 Tax=Polyodon spathula TaxID=7913 RepID=UPI001B7DB890|nr:putative helicase MOV-10 [Polyodon spathula]
MPTVRDNFKTGLEFIEHLDRTQRIQKNKREELRSIYNEEFRNRDEIRRPNFSCIVFALKKNNKVKVKKGLLYFNPPSVEYFGDQWRRPRQQPPANSPVRMNGACPGAAPAHSPTQKELGKRKARTIIQQLRQNRSSIISDKGGIVIRSDHAFTEGMMKFEFAPEQTRVVVISVENAGPEPVKFTLYEALRRMHVFTFRDEHRVTRACPLLLSPGDTYKIQVSCLSSHYGYFPVTVVFEFRPHVSGDSKPFYIVRMLAGVANSALSKELGPTSPYKPYQIATRRPVNVQVEEGLVPESNYQPELKVVPLPNFDYPKRLKDLVKQGLEDSDRLYPELKQEQSRVQLLLESQLHFENYKERFQLLLHLEEIQMEVDIKKYDMHDAVMHPDPQQKRFLILHVPGVAENRPSVLKGDYLLVSESEDPGDPVIKYKGWVHAVQLDKLKLGFSQKLVNKHIANMKFEVTFTFNRLPLKLQHRAVELAVKHDLRDFLFPTCSLGTNLPIPTLRLYDQNLGRNPEQEMAVKCIVAGTSRPAPFLVFGPPGTGKTVTIVEAIKQVHFTLKDSRILACAPSNSASDLLCQRLLQHVDKHAIYRLNAFSRDPGDLPADILPCSNWDSSLQSFVFPAKEVLMEKYRILVTTVVTAGRLVSGGIPPGHFSHIFIDEAGHAVEPECIIPVAGLLNKDQGQLVLAGDPKQLGPILRSPLAIRHGLDVSLLERLMTQNSLYQKDSSTGAFNSHFVTKLLRNYRSHPAILKIPNELFYDGELQVFANEILRNSFCTWENLPKKGFPVVFHGVQGLDEREGNSPSFFNVSEIDVVVSHVKKLLQNQGKKGIRKLSPKEIGIISPYRKQVQKIRSAVNTVDKELKSMPDIKELKVGSVEEFQGQERTVILISTVRSTMDYLKMDEDFKLGFLKNPKRFNVAMTRAKALLIVVGNPFVLSKDPIWHRFIQYCSEGGGYTGYDFTEEEEEEETLVTRLASLDISAEPEDTSGESAVQQQQEPEWRNEL